MVTRKAGAAISLEGHTGGPGEDASGRLPRADGLAPGSSEAEAAADALLLRARECGLRVARGLRVAAAAAADRGASLRSAAEDLALSCAYYTEEELRRWPRIGGRRRPPASLADADGEPAAGLSHPGWLGGLAAPGLAAMAARLQLPARQAEVWAAHVRGDSLTEIAAALGLSRSTTYAHLVRAHRRVRAGWLAAYRESLHRR